MIIDVNGDGDGIYHCPSCEAAVNWARMRDNHSLVDWSEMRVKCPECGWVEGFDIDRLRND